MIEKPRIARQRLAPKPGIVHLGLGAFSRSFVAPVVEDAVGADGGDWGIIGASLRSPDIRDRLEVQDFVYTAVEMAPTGQHGRILNVLSEVIFAPEAHDLLLLRMADPTTRIVSLTVTEKGYCYVPGAGAMDSDHPDVLHDIQSHVPRSAIGFIVRALEMRKQAGLRPFTVLSCDNLPNNGCVTRKVVIGLARMIDPGLAAWIEDEVRFPSTMVDRIVPATTPENIGGLADDTNTVDEAPVFHEPFLQWVIEDSFVDNARPAFEKVDGVQIVRDVAPFELMKIRMLNGTHSALAYLGYLAGHETIADTAANPLFGKFIRSIWSREIIPTLEPPEGVDLERYADDLFARYSNPAIRHRTWQIAMDGSQKLPQRILGAVADNLTANRLCDGLFLAVAAWMRYVGGTDENGNPIDVRDPLSVRLRNLSNGAEGPDEAVDALLSVSEVFGSSVDPIIREGVLAAYRRLIAKGAEASVGDVA